MIKLGLLPPYTSEDIQAAYHEKAKAAHPDRGGSQVQFLELKEAYDRANEYVKFRQNRFQWLAANVERYAVQEAIGTEVQRRCGQVEIEGRDWVKQSYGDFALVAEMLRGIRLRGQTDGDQFLSFLAEHKEGLAFLQSLDVADCRITDPGLARLSALCGLRRLDLSRNPISRTGLKVLEALPELAWINLSGTAVSWWGRWGLRRAFPKLRVVAKAT